MAKQKLEWRTEQRRVDELVPFEGNPRLHDYGFIASLKKMVGKLGLVEIPAIDLDNTVLAGHARLKVLKLLGRSSEMIDVRVPSRKLTDGERQSYLLASNAVRGSWDYDLLRGFDPELILSIGFNPDELAQLWDNQLETEEDDFDEESELVKIKVPTVKPGDLFQLGLHRLICANSEDLSEVKRLVGREQIDLVDVDPPFNIKWSYKGKRGQYGGQEKDDKTPERYHSFLKTLLQNSLAVSKKDAHFLMWCDERWVWLLQKLYAELGITSRRLCLWLKNGPAPTNDVAFGKATEFATYGTIGSPHLDQKVRNLHTVMNKEVGTGNRTIDDASDLFNVWLIKRLPGNEYEHPTQKPPTLHEKILRRCTRVGDNVLDLCGGSGSLLIACEQMKRRAFLSEVDPIFATLILNRYEKLTGRKAHKLN